MERKSFTTLPVCALGIFIGATISLDLTARFALGYLLWPLGALFGGMLAYIMIDFQHFCAGVAYSYHRTIAWRPHRLWWRALGSCALVDEAMILTLLSALFIVAGSAMAFSPEVRGTYTVRGIFIYAPLAIIALSLLFLPISVFMDSRNTIARRDDQTLEEWEESLVLRIGRNWDMARTENPMAVAIRLAHYTLRGLGYCAAHSPEAAILVGSSLKAAGKTLGMFAAGVFVSVHSKRRTVCFVVTFIGTAIGYFCGNATLYAIVGGVFGLVYDELVSVRWLKIQR